MDHLATIPITILVKAPDQKIGDQTVECFMEWTVRRLKSHLAAVYPNKPTEKSQRIIYSGKLLQDHSVLKDVLRTIDNSTLHTVHLVCTPTPEELAEIDKLSSSKSSNPPNSPSGTSSAPNRTEDSDNPNASSTSSRTNVEEPSTDGVRQRHASRHNSYGNTGHSTSYMNQFSMPGSPSAYQSMSPQQLQWMQQLYAQQMAAAYYMQYHQGLPGVSVPWTPPATYQFPGPVEQPPIANFNAQPAGNRPVPLVDNNNAMPRAAAPNVAPPRNAAPRVQNQQMNAGVGPAMNDDEEEGANRDWLDWLHTLFRFGFILCMVYFYSSMNRFLLVAGIMIVIYLYQHNFFRLHRAPVARVQVEERVDPLENRPDAQGNDPPDGSGNADGNDASPSTDEPSDSPNSDNQSSDGTVEESTVPESDGPTRPGFFGTLWIFVSTFFTSLLPQGPQQLNVN